ncbi:cilia- and flagella-associated protein 299 isoform 2-T2 [Syngnathus typhle]
MGSSNTNIQDAVTRFKDYKEYLDSKMTSMDLVFLTSKEVARKLVEHGHRGTVLSRREFEQQKAASASATHYHRNQTTTLASSGCDIRDNFLRELAEREEANGTGKMTVIAALHPRRERRGSGSVWLFGLRPQTADPGLCAILQRQEEASARTPGFMLLQLDQSDVSFHGQRQLRRHLRAARHASVQEENGRQHPQRGPASPSRPGRAKERSAVGPLRACCHPGPLHRKCLRCTCTYAHI